MPTASEYWDAERDVREYLVQLKTHADVAGSVAGATALSGGSIVGEIDGVITEGALQLADAVRLGGELADELGRRAEVCAAYASRVEGWDMEWRNSDEAARSLMRERPKPPYSWVTRL